MTTPTLAANALTTEVRTDAALGLFAGNTTFLINSASAWIENYCKRQFAFQSGIVEDKGGFGTDKLVLDRPPILALTSITLDGSTVDLTDVVIESVDGGVIQRTGGFFWTAHRIPSISEPGLPGSERPLYQVTYDGGFVLPKDDSQATPRTLPFDIEQAVFALIRAFQGLFSRNPNLKSEKLLSWSGTYRDDVVPPGIKALLDPYRRLIP